MNRMELYNYLVLAVFAIAALSLLGYSAGLFFRIESLFLCLPVFFVLVLLLFPLWAAGYLITSDMEKIEFAIKRWNKVKKAGWDKPDPSFTLFGGERVEIPLSAAVIKGRSFLSIKIYPRDLIVTNKRIIIGFKWFGIKQTFDEMNLWHPQSGSDRPYGGRMPLAGLLGGNTVIRRIELKEVIDRKGEFDWDSVKLSMMYGPQPISITIFSPHAKRIYGIMSGPIKE